jgi:polyadenylate-binding protein
VKDLNTSANEADVFALFSKYGKVTSGVIMKNDNGASKGFGFFNYEAHEQAQAAVEALNNFEFLGKRIYVARAQKISERRRELEQTYKSYLMDHLRKGTNLYVKNLDDDVTDSMLQGLPMSFLVIMPSNIFFRGIQEIRPNHFLRCHEGREGCF